MEPETRCCLYAERSMYFCVLIYMQGIPMSNSSTENVTETIFDDISFAATETRFIFLAHDKCVKHNNISIGAGSTQLHSHVAGLCFIVFVIVIWICNQ